MIFFLPLLVLIMGIIFGIDHVYFKNENEQIKAKIEHQDKNASLEEKRKEYIENLFKAKEH